MSEVHSVRLPAKKGPLFTASGGSDEGHHFYIMAYVRYEQKLAIGSGMLPFILKLAIRHENDAFEEQVVEYTFTSNGKPWTNWGFAESSWDDIVERVREWLRDPYVWSKA